MMYGFNLLFWIAGLIAWKRPIDLLPVVSISLAIFRFEKNEKRNNNKTFDLCFQT